MNFLEVTGCTFIVIIGFVILAQLAMSAWSAFEDMFRHRKYAEGKKDLKDQWLQDAEYFCEDQATYNLLVALAGDSVNPKEIREEWRKARSRHE